MHSDVFVGMVGTDEDAVARWPAWCSKHVNGVGQHAGFEAYSCMLLVLAVRSVARKIVCSVNNCCRLCREDSHRTSRGIVLESTNFCERL